MKHFLTIQHCKKHMLPFYLTYMIPNLFYFCFIFCFSIHYNLFIFQLPSSEEQWKANRDEFDRRRNYPHSTGHLTGNTSDTMTRIYSGRIL
jgi:hypothetical protein